MGAKILPPNNKIEKNLNYHLQQGSASSLSSVIELPPPALKLECCGEYAATQYIHIISTRQCFRIIASV